MFLFYFLGYSSTKTSTTSDNSSKYRRYSHFDISSIVSAKGNATRNGYPSGPQSRSDVCNNQRTTVPKHFSTPSAIAATNRFNTAPGYTTANNSTTGIIQSFCSNSANTFACWSNNIKTSARSTYYWTGNTNIKSCIAVFCRCSG